MHQLDNARPLARIRRLGTAAAMAVFLAAVTLGNTNSAARPEGTNGHTAVLDFDGDGRTDEVLTRGFGGGTDTWYTLGSTAGFSATNWGIFGSDFEVPADYDGDGKWDIAVWRPSPVGAFYILQSQTNTLRTQTFGQVGDDPRVTQDFDGDGLADPAVTRSEGSALTWYILRSSLGFTGVTFGLSASDLPLRGDYDGDNKADVAVYRGGSASPANTFFVLPSGGGPVRSQPFGNTAVDIILPADFDGDGKTDYAIFRAGFVPGRGTWYWLRSTDGALSGAPFGDPDHDVPTPGDYDGDGTTDLATWRRIGTPTFYHLGSTVGFFATTFGLGADNPVSFNLQARN